MCIRDSIKDNKCPECGSEDLTEPRPFNLMFKTSVGPVEDLSLIHISEPTRLRRISYAVFCLKKKKKQKKTTQDRNNKNQNNNKINKIIQKITYKKRQKTKHI